MAKAKVLKMADIAAGASKALKYARIQGFTEDDEFVIRSVTAGDMIEWSEANEGEAKKTAHLRLIIKSLVDGEPGVDEGATGSLIASMSDLPTFRALPMEIIERMVKDIMKLNGLQMKDAEKVKNG